MSSELIFASADRAFEYLSELTGKRILIAKTLEQLMPELIERAKKRNIDHDTSLNTDEEIKNKIIDLASLDPKNEGALNKPSKPIHVFLEWYLKNPSIMQRFLDSGDFQDDIKQFNEYRGNGKTTKDIKDFSGPQAFAGYLYDLGVAERQNKKEQFFKNETPNASYDNINAYYIDDSWEDLGRSLFEEQTKWCVNEEDNYDDYVPLYLFTEGNGNRYHALFSPSEKMFKNRVNDNLTIDEAEELVPLLEKLNIYEEFETSDSGDDYLEHLRKEAEESNPPEDELDKYIEQAWEDRYEDYFTDALNMKFEKQLDKVEKEVGKGLSFDSIDYETEKYESLEELFLQTSKDVESDWEWAREGDHWEVTTNLDKIVNMIKWNDVKQFFMDKTEFDISMGLFDVKIDGLSENRKKVLQNKYPEYFKMRKEHHGQQKMFSSVEKAIQHLSDITGKRILIAKTLEQLMPELIERAKKRNIDHDTSLNTDEEIEKKILDLASLDPKNEGALNKPSKPIHVFLEWYLKSPSSMEKYLRDSDFQDDLRRFNQYRGNGKTTKTLKDFDDPSKLMDHLDELDEKARKDKKELFFKNETPNASSGGINAYYIDDSWEDLGQALFEEQTKWCVNEESNYDGYSPLWFFTEGNGNSYYALFSPGDGMFKNRENDNLTTDEVEELMPLLEKLGLVDDFERSDSGEEYREEQEPPYDNDYEYANSAWDGWVGRQFSNRLESHFGGELEDLAEEMGEEEIFEVSDIDDSDLWELFQETARDAEIYWEWNRDDGDWAVDIDYDEIADRVDWEDIARFFMDNIEKVILKNTMMEKGELGKIDSERIKILKKKYPEYFKQLAEHHGQQKMFSSVEEAIQHLSDITGKRIMIAASLADTMPQLVERIKSKSTNIKTDEEAEKKIKEIAYADPKFDGNMNQAVKPIHALLNWYLKYPSSFEKNHIEELAKEIKKFNTLRGQGKTNKKLTDFDDPEDFIEHLETLDMEMSEDIKSKILSKPDGQDSIYRAYKIDGSWKDEGEPVFGEQTHWCVNQQHYYNSYNPVWLFTKRHRYFALLSDGRHEFHNANNDELTEEEIDELMPLIKEMNLTKEFENSDSGDGGEPPFEDEWDYIRSAYDSWMYSDFADELDEKYEEKIEEFTDGEMDITDLSDGELFGLFSIGIESGLIETEWERNNENQWEASVRIKSVVDALDWDDDIAKFFMDDIELNAYENRILSKGRLNNYPAKKLEKLRKKYPKYFRSLAEEYGQKKLFEETT